MRGSDKGIHIFLKVISPKLTVITQMAIELADYNVVVLHVSHYATGRPTTIDKYDSAILNLQKRAIHPLQSI